MLACSTVQSLDIKADACHVRECPYSACCNPRHLFWGSHPENCKQREQEKREVKRRSAALPPMTLGHETHEEHRRGVDSSVSNLGLPYWNVESANPVVSLTS